MPPENPNPPNPPIPFVVDYILTARGTMYTSSNKVSITYLQGDVSTGLKESWKVETKSLGEFIEVFDVVEVRYKLRRNGV